MQPAREARCSQIAFGRGAGIGPHATTGDGLKLERDEAEDMVVVGMKIRGHRKAATDGAAGTLMGAAAEGQAPALHARVDGAVRIELIGIVAEQTRIPIRGDDVEDDE